MAFSRTFHITTSMIAILCQTIHAASPEPCGSEQSINGMMLKGHVFQTIKASFSALHALDCLTACNNDIRCQSFNYVISQSICELNNRTKEAKPDNFVPNPERYYFKRYKDRGKIYCMFRPTRSVNRNFDSSKGATEIIRKLLTLFFLHKYMIMTYAV